MSSCTKRRLSVVQRCPLVPIAAKVMARIARSRSADGATMAALLPESSRSARAERLASRSPTARPIIGEAGGGTDGKGNIPTRISPSFLSPISKTERPLGAVPNLAAAFSKSAWVASAVSGVFSDGFQMQALPQTSASAAFQDQTPPAKLKDLIIPLGPTACHLST